MALALASAVLGFRFSFPDKTLTAIEVLFEMTR